MSRIRYIKPGFFTNEELAECDPLARILFAGLWTEADRDGRLEDRPRRIKVSILPYDECDIEALLEQLHQRGFIVRYVVDGRGYIAMPMWYAHQRPVANELSKHFPAPPKRTAKSAHLQESSEKVIPMSEKIVPVVYGEGGMGNGELVTGKGDGEELSATDVACVTTPRSIIPFTTFWSSYPKKAGKAAASKKWLRMTTKQREHAVFASQAVAFAVAEGFQDVQYVPHGSTFLNKELYEDWFSDDGKPVVAPDYERPGNGKLTAETARLAQLIAETYSKEER